MRNQTVLGHLHGGQRRNLIETMIQVTAKQLQRIKVILSHIVQLVRAWSRPHVSIEPQRFFKCEELTDAGQHRVNQEIERAIVAVGKFNLLIDEDFSDFLERC